MKRGIKIDIFKYVNISLLILVAALMLFPFLHIIAKSLSSERFVLANAVVIFPKGLNFQSYDYVLHKKLFLFSFRNSVFVTMVGVLISMFATVTSAFAFSRTTRLKTKGIFSLLLTFYLVAMYFDPGIIPKYLVVKSFGLLDTLWALILPVAIIPFNLFVMRNFFLSIPESIYESALMDGASNSRILISIYIPMSKAGIATVSMFFAVRYWNVFIEALLYINKMTLMPLQLYLRQMLLDATTGVADAESMIGLTTESVRAASIIAVTLPILFIYPFAQKYFVKGTMIGAIKG